ncbi:MAG: RDD family protein [Pseudomonadota bacterium]
MIQPQTDHSHQANRGDVFDYPGNQALFEATLSRRALAFIIDFIIVGALISFAIVFLFLAGIPTLTLAWLLIPVTPAAIALLYIAMTLGSERARTIGMGALGLCARMSDGTRPGVIIALFHTLVFYFSVGVLTPFVLLVGFFTKRQRLLHDFLSGMLFVNQDQLPEEYR